MAIRKFETSTITSQKNNGLWDKKTTKLDVLGDGSCKALWRFDGNVLDDSGNYNGTASNVTFSTLQKKMGTHSAVFNGSNSTISIPSVLNAFPLTVSVWAQHDLGWYSASNINTEIINMSIAGNRLTIGFVQESTWTRGPTIMYGNSNHWTCNSGTAGLAGDKENFHHIVYVCPTYNDANTSFYVDGVKIPSVNNGGGHGGTAGWNIGSNSAGAEHFPGKLDNLRIFNKALTQAEITYLYNNGIGL
jgi:hypothetical protein